MPFEAWQKAFGALSGQGQVNTDWLQKWKAGVLGTLAVWSLASGFLRVLEHVCFVQYFLPNTQL